jgi:hypothetical protein
MGFEINELLPKTGKAEYMECGKGERGKGENGGERW